MGLFAKLIGVAGIIMGISMLLWSAFGAGEYVGGIATLVGALYIYETWG